jgi:ribosomal-protein-alanine N-acetyltransferase
MPYTFTPLNKEEAQAIFSWHYDGQYATYDLQGDLEDDNELLDRRSPHYAVRDERGELIGFFGFGSSSSIQEHSEPYLFSENGSLLVGLGMRPDLTGKGLGVEFVQAGLDFARREFAPRTFRLYVMSWNKRAIKVYEKVGFQQMRRVLQKNIHGENEFIEMVMDA